MPVSSNFFVDFAFFNIIGLLAGLDWMVAFSAATFLAMATSHFAAGAAERRFRLKAQRAKPNHDALPAFRDQHRDGHRR